MQDQTPRDLAVATAGRHEAGRHFAGIVQALPFGLMIVAADGRIVLANAALEQIFGYEAGEMLGKSMELLLPAPLRAAHPQLRASYAAAPEIRPMGGGRDLLAQRKDGREIPVEVALTPVETAEGGTVLAAVTDISVRKKAEAVLVQMNAQLEEFTYIASHDLRSPLRGIADLLGWIREDIGEAALSETVRMNFDRAALRVARAERMIDDLLDYARAGHVDRRVTRIEPRRFVEESLSLIPPPPGFTLELHGDAAAFDAAATPLALALRNLVANAYKHHGGETGIVRVLLAEDGGYFAVTVEDDGAGIPPGADERIFKLFQRSTARTPGHGVGLAVTRRVVNTHGGTIVLDRQGALGGACFCLHWPRFPIKETEA